MVQRINQTVIWSYSVINFQ